MGAAEDGDIRQGSDQTTQVAISRDQFLAWKRQKVFISSPPWTGFDSPLNNLQETKNPSFFYRIWGFGHRFETWV